MSSTGHAPPRHDTEVKIHHGAPSGHCDISARTWHLVSRSCVGPGGAAPGSMYEDPTAHEREPHGFEDRGPGLRHSNPIALMIIAEWIEKRDHEDADVDHGFRVMRGE